jgi:hypothetical protein
VLVLAAVRCPALLATEEALLLDMLQHIHDHCARLLKVAHVNGVLPSSGVVDDKVVVGPRVQRTAPKGVRPARCRRQDCARSSRASLEKETLPACFHSLAQQNDLVIP